MQPDMFQQYYIFLLNAKKETAMTGGLSDELV